MPRIVLAFDSFKGSLTALEACQAAALGVRDVCPGAEIVMVPLSDGGEGLVACLHEIFSLKTVTLQAHDPLMSPLTATYALSPDGKTAYMEMAATSGLCLVPPHKRNPLLATTYGVGEMILDAFRRGCSHIVLGLGGSATSDAGEGMLRCLEDHDVDLRSNSLPRITAVCDVDNPLHGPNGAAHVFAPQKGATRQQVSQLDERLKEFAQRAQSLGFATERDSWLPGVGAAGGLGYGLVTYLRAQLLPGIDTILQVTGFSGKIQYAQAILTGEGKSDRQTLMGKVPSGVLRHGMARGIPVFLLSGCIEDGDSLMQAGFASVRSINQHDTRPVQQLMEKEIATNNLRLSVAKLCKSFTD